MSPLLFNCALDEIFSNLNWETKGMKINGHLLNSLRFVDYMVLAAGGGTICKPCWRNSAVKSRSAGTEINMSKTEILPKTQQHQKIEIKGQETEIVDSIIYLG